MLATNPCQQVQSRTHRQHEGEQQQGQHQVGLTQTLDSPVHPGDHRCHRGKGDSSDDQYLGGVGGRHAEQIGQSRRRLLGAQPQRGGQSEERGKHREHVDQVAEPAPDRLAQNRVERRPERQRQAEIVGGEGERERDDRVHRPRVQSPVKNGGSDCHPLGGDRVPGVDPERRIPEVVNRFRHPEEHQADADPGREQHGEPRPEGVVGPGVRTAEANATERSHHQQQAEQDEEVARAQKHPVERRSEPGVQRVESGGRGLPERQHAADEPDDGEAGYGEYRVVNVEPQEPDVVLADPVVGLGVVGGHAGSEAKGFSETSAIHSGLQDYGVRWQ